MLSEESWESEQNFSTKKKTGPTRTRRTAELLNFLRNVYALSVGKSKVKPVDYVQLKV